MTETNHAASRTALPLEPSREPPGAGERHTVQRFSHGLAELNSLVLRMGGLVERQIDRGVMALADNNLETARDVIARDEVVNFLDVQADERIVTLLALRQPMGRDLRAIMSLGKAVTDLERIGDEAKRIAEHIIYLVKGKDVRHVSPETLDRDVLGG